MPGSSAVPELQLYGTLAMSQPGNPSDTPTSTSPRGGRSHFAAGAKLTGDLTVPGAIELLGHVDGKITADSIVIEESGSAIGELHADRVAIKGSFEGSIHGRDVKLHSSARVSGEIVYQTLSIDSGAEVNSSCSHRKASEAQAAKPVS
jgi:cytoskeletal protein CcmA (bactofilin family)